MQRANLIQLADQLIKMGEYLRKELVNSECTIYYKRNGVVHTKAWPTWQTDEEVIEWCEENNIKEWWR